MPGFSRVKRRSEQNAGALQAVEIGNQGPVEFCKVFGIFILYVGKKYKNTKIFKK